MAAPAMMTKIHLSRRRGRARIALAA